MYKKIIISIIVLSQIVIWGCGSEEQTFLLDDLKGKGGVFDGAVDSSEEALLVLKNQKLVDIVALEDIEGEANSNMIVTVKKQPGQWTVLIKTRTSMPSYSCEYAMDDTGKPIGEENYITKKCDWNK